MCIRSLAHMMWWGVECVTWIWVARSTLNRSALSVNGNEDLPSVLEGNCVRDYAVSACSIIHWSGRYFVIEQPQSSLLNLSIEFTALLNLASADTIVTQHGAFEADSTAPAKPLKLMSSATWIHLMRNMCVQTGNKRITLTTSPVWGNTAEP